jgi:hypothetical protein
MRVSCRSLQASVQIFTPIALSICKRLQFVTASAERCSSVYFMQLAWSCGNIHWPSSLCSLLEAQRSANISVVFCRSLQLPTDSSLFNDTGYHTVAFRVCETVWSGICRLGVTELRKSVGRSVIPSLVFNAPPPPPKSLLSHDRTLASQYKVVTLHSVKAHGGSRGLAPQTGNFGAG